jgi:hypothetical protein
MDPDPRIARDLMQKLLHGNAQAAVVRQREMN